MSFRRKTYPEVAESLLNRLLGGVSGEAHPYPPAKATREPYRHALERQPVDRITAVWGARNGETFRFAPDADYVLSADGAQALGPGPKTELADALLDLIRERLAGASA